MVPQRTSDWALGKGESRPPCCCGPYLVLARFSDDLAYGTHEANFNLFILSIIVLAGVVVGLQTYPSMAEDKGIGYVAARLRTLPLPPLLFRPLHSPPTPPLTSIRPPLLQVAQPCHPHHLRL